MICPKCSANIDDRSYYCNRCGAAQTQPDAQDRYASQDRYGSREYRSDQQQPAKSELDTKIYLIFSLICFGWAAVKGISSVIGLLRLVISSISFFSTSMGFSIFTLVSAVISVGIHFAAPLIIGVVLLKKYHNDVPQ